MKIFRFWSRLYVAHLEEEILYLRAQVEHERQRAEEAIDELLRIRVAAGPVTKPTPTEAAKQETLVDKLLRDGEFASVGVAEAE